MALKGKRACADSTRAAYTPRMDRLGYDVINVAHISVSGVGGLGLIAMAAVAASLRF
jgi:hypothetical protein